MPQSIDMVEPVAPMVGAPAKKRRSKLRARLEKVALEIDKISPASLAKTSEQELLALHLRTHQLWGVNFKGNTKDRVGNLARQELIDAHQAIADEMQKRGLHHSQHLMKSGAKPVGLSCDPARAKAIMRGEIRLLLSPSSKGLPVDRRVIVVAGTPTRGQAAPALGEIRLRDPFPVSTNDLRLLSKITAITPERGRELFSDKSEIWGFPIIVLRTFDQPREIHEARRVPLKDAAPLVKSDPLSPPTERKVPQIALGFIFDASGRTFLVTHRHGEIWTPPAGFLNGREPGMAAYQEASAESGLQLEPQGSLPRVESSRVIIYPFVFMAWGQHSEPLPKGIEGRWVEPEQLVNLKGLAPSFNMFRRAVQVVIKPTVDLVRAHDRPETLSPAELVETDAWLHILGRIDTDTHQILQAEMERRHITHPGGDAHLPDQSIESLEQADLKPTAVPLAPERAKEVQKIFDGAPEEFVLVPEWASVSGSAIYAQDREPNDTDWIFREPYPTQGTLLKIARVSQDLTHRPAHFSFESSGPNWTYLPVYDLVARRRPDLEIHPMHEAGMNEFAKAALQDLVQTPELLEQAGDLPTNGKDLKLMRPFAHYKAAAEFDPEEMYTLWSKWVEPNLKKGHRIIVQEKYDGMRLHLNKDGDKMAIFTESGTERSQVFPDLAALLAKFKAHDFMMDCEFVQWTNDNSKPAPRWIMTWMIVGKEPQAVPVHIDVHDLMWLDGKSLVNAPYEERMKKLDGILPGPITSGKLTITAAETHEITDQASFKRWMSWARGIPGSEGAMLKWYDFPYHGGIEPGIVKAKSVTELDVAIIGWKKNPGPKPAGAHWDSAQAVAAYRQQLKGSRTYIFRVAVGHHGKLIPLESARRLTEKDLKLTWDEKDQKWEGTDDPRLWHMCPGFSARKSGDYAYANTYALAMDEPPFCHEILTIAPMQFRAFKHEDGTWGYSWIFPRVKNTKIKGSIPGELEDILTKFGQTPVEKYLNDGKASPLKKADPEERNMLCMAEDDVIRTNQQSAQAQGPHSFMRGVCAAPNGGARCVICGGPEPTPGGLCIGLGANVPPPPPASVGSGPSRPKPPEAFEKARDVTCPNCEAVLEVKAPGWVRCTWCKQAILVGPDWKAKTEAQAGEKPSGLAPFTRVLKPGKVELKKAGYDPICPHCGAELSVPMAGWYHCGWCGTLIHARQEQNGHWVADLPKSQDTTLPLFAPSTLVIKPGKAEFAQPTGPSLLVKAAADEVKQGIMVALSVPLPAGEELQKQIKGKLPDHSELLPLEELHITLAYLGKVGDASFPREKLQKTVAEFAKANPPLAGKITGVGRFVGDKQEAAYYATFDCPELPSFRERLVQALKQADIPMAENHGYSPHITLAYVPASAKNLPAQVPTMSLKFGSVCVVWAEDWAKLPLTSAHLAKSQMFPDTDTPQYLFDFLNNKFHFTLDACASDPQAKVAQHFTPEQDALAQTWTGTIWCHPPFDQLDSFMKKACESGQAGATVVCFVPPETETGWWQNYAMKGRILFVKSRVRLDNGTDVRRALVVFGPGVKPGSGSIEIPKPTALAKKSDPYVNPPPENKTYRFVYQHHYRGKSVHGDWRIEHGGFLIGWTVMEQTDNEIKEPVETLKQAKALDTQPNLWKINWDQGVIRDRSIKGGQIRRASLRAAEKAEEIPEEWLTVDGPTTKPEPGQPPPVGATRNYPGVFSIVDHGEAEYGAQKPWVHEFFLHGSKLKGRWVVRLLNLGKSRLEKAAKLGLLPEGKVEPSSRVPFLWLVIQPDDQTPYVLGQEAINKKWMPPAGFSALPKAIRDHIPADHQYWKMSGDKALTARDDLAKNWEELAGPGVKLNKSDDSGTVVAVFDELPDFLAKEMGLEVLP